jgi:hypothetical protein
MYRFVKGGARRAACLGKHVASRCMAPTQLNQHQVLRLSAITKCLLACIGTAVQHGLAITTSTRPEKCPCSCPSSPASSPPPCAAVAAGQLHPALPPDQLYRRLEETVGGVCAPEQLQPLSATLRRQSLREDGRVLDWRREGQGQHSCAALWRGCVELQRIIQRR